MTAESASASNVRYEPNDKLPKPLAFGLGLQFAVLCIAGIVLTPAIVIRAAGGGETYLSWAVFAAVAISGVTTILQAVRVGRFGSGYVLVMGTSATFIAVCIAAISKGGPAMLGMLVIIASLFQFVLSGRLSLLRRILTPTVSGTVIMLIAVTVMPVAFDMLKELPEGVPSTATPLTVVTTLVIMVTIALRGNAIMRLWAPLIGVVAGSILAGFFGLYDTRLVAEAGWIGLPEGNWPGLNLDFGPVFWGLLPAFIFATLVGAIETIGDGLAIQRVSWRKPRAPDFRAVQGAVAADGVGNLLSGLAGTVPNTTYSTSVSVTELTGVGGAPGRNRSGSDLPGRGVSPQGACADPGHPGTRGGGLRHRPHGDAVHRRDQAGVPGRNERPQRPDLRSVLLDRYRIPGRRHLPGILLGLCRRDDGERHDGRRTHGGAHDPLHRTHRAAAAAA